MSETGSKSSPKTDVAVDGEMTVYGTKSGNKDHRESCRWGNAAMSLEKAREKYTPCAKCNPLK